MEKINQLDIAFVVDTTGSMAGLIGAAQAQMIDMIDKISRAAGIDLRFGLVQYRDHPPQDQMVYETSAFTCDLDQARAIINGLRADGGGDEPEAVLDGVLAACQELRWRPHARRIAVLVGDAPPHGVGCPGDHFVGGCPCGQTIESVTCTAEEARITLYALGLTPRVADSFGKLSRYTGGEYFEFAEAAKALEKIEGTLAAEFSSMELDERVLAMYEAVESFSIDDAAEKLAAAPGAIAASLTRLAARRLLRRKGPAAEPVTI